MSGFFITFEGIEGSGKTTQIRLLADYLAQQGKKVVLTREPGGTAIGDKIRTVLLNPDFKSMTSMTELFLYAAARCQHVEEFIRPALERGAVVLCDRYADATTAYQGFGRGIDRKLLATLHQLATRNLWPHLTFVLDCPVETGLQRALSREAKRKGPAADRFEKEERDLHERVRQGYLQLAQEEPKRVKIVEASDPPDQIHKVIIKCMDPLDGRG